MARKGRIEDSRLLTGKGHFTDDFDAPDALWTVFLRSPYASARLTAFDAADARDMPGVVAVLRAQDLAEDGIADPQSAFDLTDPDGRRWQHTPRPLLAGRHVRFAGEPLAMVVAETRAQALDAAEAIVLDFEEQEAVATTAEAMAEGAPLVHDDRPGNLAYSWGRGDWAAAEEALASSAHRVRLESTISRVTAVAMEPRTALAMPEGEGWCLRVSMQKPTVLHAALVKMLKLDPAMLRVVAPDVGGSFGMKMGLLREEMLVLWAARRLGRPLRWRADRSEDFLSDEGGRDLSAVAELGLDPEGNFTVLTVRALANAGAYAGGRALWPMNNIGGIAGVYRTPLIAARLDSYLTHTVPIAAYRGAGRPEATFLIETLIDRAARELGLDRVELRRRNLIPEEAMPWSSPFLLDYDCGAFEEVLDASLARNDVAGFGTRRKASEDRGLLRGLGIALCIETAGATLSGPATDWTDLELMPDGSLRIAAGAFSAGTGLETAFTDLAAETLGVAPETISYVQGDTAILDRGAGMGGSGGMVKGASALLEAGDRFIRQARALAAEELEADIADIEYEAGRLTIAGTDRSLDFQQLAQVASRRGIRVMGEGAFSVPRPTYPNGCHVCEVEIDPETGLARPVRYGAIEDIGRVINDQLAEGQLHGGIAQALGQVFAEDMRYGAGDGQLLTGSLMDYAIPRAADLPRYDTGFFPRQTALNPLGVKGVGEAGSVGALAAAMNAVQDALSREGVQSFDMPASPARIWTALQAARTPE